MSDRSESRTGLARRLRELRTKTWVRRRVTQRQLGAAFKPEDPLTESNFSAWENGKAIPDDMWLAAYATFFATERSIGGDRPRLLSDDDLTEAEFARRESVLAELLKLKESEVRRESQEVQPRSAAVEGGGLDVWRFGPGEDVTIVCAQLPEKYMAHSAYSDPRKPDFVLLYTFADADALFELNGYIRERNPGIKVYRRTVQELENEDLKRHLVLLGGVDWNARTRDVLDRSLLPVKQVGRIPEGTGAFEVQHEGKISEFEPTFDSEKRLEQDVALFYHGVNPYNPERKVTICNGMYGRGTLGVAKALTEESVRGINRNYLAQRFGKATTFGIISRVDVGEKTVPAPNWSMPEYRLYEWPEVVDREH